MRASKVKSFVQRKNEEALLLQKKEESIKTTLDTAKNNPQFIKLINYTLTTLENLIASDNSEKYINIYSIIKLNGIKILCNVASVNVKNDELINQTTDIMKRFLNYDNPKNNELSKFFVEKSGHMDIFQLLISIKSDKGIKSLLETLNKIAQVPQLANILLDSGIVDTMKFLSDNHGKNLEINDILYKIISKITNYRKGRDMILNYKLVPGVISYIEQNLKSNNIESVFNGLIILDNICKNEKGKGFIKELNIHKILGETLTKYFNDSQIIHKVIKIYNKIIIIRDITEKIEQIKEIFSDDVEKHMKELNDILNFISNFILVQDVNKEVSSLDNMNIIINLFNKIYTIDIQNKNKEFLIDFATLMKYFMIIFKRAIQYDPEYLDKNNNKGKIFFPIIESILDCVKKNWEGFLPIIINQEKELKNEIKRSFKHFFSSYCEIVVDIYNSNYKNINNMILLIEYILDKIIINSKKYFNTDERFNYYFSFLLKIIIEIIMQNQNLDNLYSLLINCFPYFKEVISKSENWETLSNFLDLILSLIKNTNNSQIKEDIIPIIHNFMIKKPKFRYPNLVNLKILDNYLTPEFIKKYLSKKNKENGIDEEINKNKNFDLDFVSSICSVMMKGFYNISSENKESININENKYINKFKEERNKETEKKILIEGGKLLKKIISPEEFLEKVKLFTKLVKEYDPINSAEESIDFLKQNIIFQICALSMKEFLNKGMEEVFKAIKDLIIKEINYIENYKRENAKDKDSNPIYANKCKKSSILLKLCLTALRKIEDGIIINYTEKNDEKYNDILKQIISLNLEIIVNSTDPENQMVHFIQLKKNASFLNKNEKKFKLSGPSVIEQFLNSLLNLLRKIINEDLCLLIFETFILFSSYNKEIYNLLIKGGCTKLIFQFLELTNSSKLCYEALQLLKNICLSKQENLMMLANQNILLTLFEVRAKFVNEIKITQLIDKIINEIMKLPGQGVLIEEILTDTIKDFHENLRHNFGDNKIRNKILNDLIIINSYSTSKTQIKKLVSKQEFIQDFIKCVNKTIQSNESSQIIERLFTCEVEIIKKIKENIDESEESLHQNFCEFLLKILFHPSIFSESFLLTANTLLLYIKDDILYDKCLSNKIDENFIGQVLDQEENYIDNPNISKVINNILSCLALKNPNFAKYIVRKGGLVNLIDDLKTIVNLNDEISLQTKLNGLIMLDSLLNEEKNMEIFINSNGIELINNIIKNEILIKQKKDIGSDFFSLEDQYRTLSIINLDTTQKKIENIKKDKKIIRRKSSNITTDIIIRESNVRNSSKFLINDEINFENNQEEDIDESQYNNDNYMFYCMKIINKGLGCNKYDFIDKETMNNLLKIAEFNFPEKFIFTQFVEFLLYYFKNYKNSIKEENNEIIENDKSDFIQNKKIIRFVLSNKAYFYSNDNLVKKAEDIENLIGDKIFGKNEYIFDFKKVLCEQYQENDNNLKYQILTYISLIIDLPLFKKVFQQIKNEMLNFFEQILKTYISSSEQNINKNQIDIDINNNIQDKNKNEGILLSLMKLYNYFIQENLINKKIPKVSENINFFENIGITSYSPNKYLFVFEFEKEISKLIEQSEGFILEENKDENKKNVKYTKNYFLHLQHIFNKIIVFAEDFFNNLKNQDYIDNKYIKMKKEDNLDNILNLVVKYYKTDEDKEKKEESYLILFETFIKMIDLLFNEEIYDIYSKNGRLFNRLKLLWKLIYYLLENDSKNIILDQNSLNKIIDVTEKLKMAIKIKENNKASLRKIPLLIAKKTENNNDINKVLYDFAVEDLNNSGKNNEKIKKIDIEILSYLSKYYTIMKEILLNQNLWKLLKDEYSKNNLPNDIRLHLAIIFRNSTKNKANLDKLIKNDSNYIQIIFSKVLKDTLKSFENNGKLIAETEMDSVCNIIKNKNYLSIIEQKNIVNNEELKAIENIYDKLDKNIGKPFKPILSEIAVDEKLQKNLQTVKEDEEKINELEELVTVNYEKHVLEFIKFYDRNKKEESLLETIVKDEILTDKKNILDANYIKDENKNKEKIKTPLSIKTNDKMETALTQLLLILIKNYNLLNTFKDDIYNVKRILLINKSLNLLQKVSLSQDNHEFILEEGFINLLEKMCEDYNNEKIKGVNKDDNNYLSNFITKGKFILKECSQSENTNSIILDSPIFPFIASELMQFNENPKVINSNNNTKKIFIYDNAIIMNIFINSKSYESIINKLGIDILLKLGTKTRNIIILENIISIITYYISITSKKSEQKINNEFYDLVFAVMEKCIRNKNRSSLLMIKTLKLACFLYTPNNIQNLDKLKLLESINNDIDIFSIDIEYLLSMLNCLCIMVKNNPQNAEECFEIGVVKKVKKILHDLTKDTPDNYAELLCKLTEFYYYLIKNKPEYNGKLNEYEITRNVVKYIDIFNNKVQPKSEQEKEIEVQQNQLEFLNDNINDESIKNGSFKTRKKQMTENEENLLNEEILETLSFSSTKIQKRSSLKNSFVRGIMMNCINYLDSITSIPEVNKYLTSNTFFNSYIVSSIQNENNDNNYLVVALHCFGNYLLSEAGISFLKSKVIDIYQLLKNLQTKYYSNSGILININYISGSIIMNKIDKNYAKMFFELIIESIKCQDWNVNLIKMALKIINDALNKNPFIIKEVNDSLIPNIINILKLYKDNYEIQLNCYKILLFFANDEYSSSFSGMINKLLQQIKQSLGKIWNDNKEGNNIKEKIKKAINNLIIFLGNIDEFSYNITNELIIPFIQELNDFGLDEDHGPYILNIFDNLFKNKNFIEPFVLHKGLDSLMKVMKSIDNNFNKVNIILQLFSILKRLLMANDEYKLQMQNMKIADLINKIIKYTSILDKKIEFEGKSLLFLIKMAKAKLEEIEEVDFTEIKIIEPIRPEVKNYLTSGKQLKLINEHGEIKEKQLFFTQDLLKVQAKLVNCNFPPKSKYVIETQNIKAIIKGYGTDAFKKSGGLFRSAPKPETCFSIIGPKTEDGYIKALNVVCRNEKEVNRWIDYMEKVINFFQKKNLLGNIELDKNTHT